MCHQSTWPISPGWYVVRWNARLARNVGRTWARWSFRIVIPPRYPCARRRSRMTVARTVGSAASIAAMRSVNGSSREPAARRT